MHPNQLIGLFELVKVEYPSQRPEWNEAAYGQIKTVYEIGQQIICLHLIEILLKYIQQERGATAPTNHDIRALFFQLPKPARAKAEKAYKQYMLATRPWTYDACRSIESLFEFLGDRPIVDMRYFWEEYKNVPVFRGDLINAFQAIFVAVLGIGHPPKDAKYQTEFRPTPKEVRVKKKNKK